MQIIERQNIDVVKWNSLVNSGNTFFSFSWYLDAVAENWAVLIDEDYSYGMALPYTKRAGLEILYTPIFVRYVEWFGSESKLKEAQSLIAKRFKIIQLNCSAELLKGNCKEVVYQVADTNRKLGSQAKRSLKKAISEELTVLKSVDYNSVFDVISMELTGKHEGLTSKSIQNLEKLFQAGKEANVLNAYQVVRQSSEGGIVCFEDEKRSLYLKGAVTENVKRNGGMYLALNSAIESALTKKVNFDFGGSKAAGVKKFNHNLGGKDAVYYAYNINNGPKWFSFLKTVRNKWKKK